MKTILILVCVLSSLFAKQPIEHKHKHIHAECEKPIIFDDTPMEKIFELKGKVYKILKGDDTNPSILYVLDKKTDKFIRIKQK